MRNHFLFLILVFVGLSGCATSTVNSVTAADEDAFEFTFDTSVPHVVPDFPWGEPMLWVFGDTDCTQARAAAETALMGLMPTELSDEEKVGRLETEHRLFEAYVADNKACFSFDIVDIEKDYWQYSPHEQVDVELEGLEIRGEYIVERVNEPHYFVRLYPCPLCL